MLSPIVRKSDQGPLATIALVALAAMALYWVTVGGPTGQMIEIDRVDPLEYQFLVDINQAEWPELAQLPAIGEILAQRIVATRKQRGPFTSADDLLEVPGIGPRKLARMNPYLLPIPDARSVAGN